MCPLDIFWIFLDFFLDIFWILFFFLESLELQGKYFPISLYIKKDNEYIYHSRLLACLGKRKGLCQILPWNMHGCHALLLKKPCKHGIVYFRRDKVLDFEIGVIFFQFSAPRGNSVLCFLAKTNRPQVLKIWLLHSSSPYHANIGKLTSVNIGSSWIIWTLKYSDEIMSQPSEFLVGPVCFSATTTVTMRLTQGSRSSYDS